MGNMVQSQKEKYLAACQELSSAFEQLRKKCADVDAFWWANGMKDDGINPNPLVDADLIGTQWEGKTVADYNIVGVTITEAFETWIADSGRSGALAKIKQQP